MLISVRRQTGRQATFPDSGAVESSRWDAVVVVVSVESVMNVHRLVIDVTLPRQHQPSNAIQSGLWAAPENRLLSSLLINPDVPCMDGGISVGVVDSGDDPLLAVRDADVSRSWIESVVRSPCFIRRQSVMGARNWGRIDPSGYDAGRKVKGKSVMSSSTSYACCRTCWSVSPKFGILISACWCCRPCSASVRSSSGF